MAAVYNDVAIGYGSFILNIGGSAYIAEDVEVSRPTKIIDRMNEKGEDSGQVIIAAKVTGTATLQLANSSSAYPSLGQVFSGSFGTSTTETFILTDVSSPFAQLSDWKARVSFVKKLN